MNKKIFFAFPKLLSTGDKLYRVLESYQSEQKKNFFFVRKNTSRVYFRSSNRTLIRSRSRLAIFPRSRAEQAYDSYEGRKKRDVSKPLCTIGARRRAINGDRNRLQIVARYVNDEDSRKLVIRGTTRSGLVLFDGDVGEQLSSRNFPWRIALAARPCKRVDFVQAYVPPARTNEHTPGVYTYKRSRLTAAGSNPWKRSPWVYARNRCTV